MNGCCLGSSRVVQAGDLSAWVERYRLPELRGNNTWMRDARRVVATTSTTTTTTTQNGFRLNEKEERRKTKDWGKKTIMVRKFERERERKKQILSNIEDKEDFQCWSMHASLLASYREPGNQFYFSLSLSLTHTSHNLGTTQLPEKWLLNNTCVIMMIRPRMFIFLTRYGLPKQWNNNICEQLFLVRQQSLNCKKQHFFLLKEILTLYLYLNISQFLSWKKKKLHWKKVVTFFSTSLSYNLPS